MWGCIRHLLSSSCSSAFMILYRCITASLSSGALTINSCAVLSWICFRAFCLPWCFTVRASFSVACLFSLCLTELDGPAHLHDNSLRTLWLLMSICSFYFIGTIIFIIPDNFIYKNLKIYYNLKEESGYLFSVCFPLQNLIWRSWVLFPLTVLRNEKYLCWKLKFTSVSLNFAVSYHTFSNLYPTFSTWWLEIHSVFIDICDFIH